MPLKTRNYRDGTLIIVDGTTPTANTLEVVGCDGDLTFSETQESFLIMRRGIIDSIREGDQQPISLSFTVKFEQWERADGASTGISVVDALKKRGGASAWESVDTCGPYMVNLQFKIKDICNPGAFEVLTFEKFVCDEVTFGEAAEYNTLRISGKCVSFPPTRTYETP